VNRIDFNQLPRINRERFVRSVAAATGEESVLDEPRLASDAPALVPICSRASRPRSALAWYLLAVVSVAALVAVGAFHFGRLTTPVQDRRFLGGYVLAAAGLGFACASIARARARRRTLPFAPGVYVLPLEVVDAREQELELHSLLELVSADPVHHQRSGAYSHTTLWLVFPTQTFTFEVRGLTHAESILARISEARRTLAASFQRGRLDELWTVDPFADARARNFEPCNEPGLRARALPIWTRFVWAIALIIGLAPGVAAWRGRNWLSDRRAYESLRAHPDEGAATAYLAAGGLHVTDVTGTILLEVRLAAAEKEPIPAKRAEALDRFLKKYPSSSVDAAARTARADALHASFLEETTVSGLRAFVERWPGAADTPAARQKIHAIYKETRADLRLHANVSDKATLPVLDAVLAWADDRSSPVLVRFRRRALGSLASTDKLLAAGLLDDEGPAKRGNAEVAVHFGPTEIADREATIVRGLEQGIRAVFPADVLSLKLGPPLDKDVPPARDPVEPTPRKAGSKRGATRSADANADAVSPAPAPAPDVTVPTIVVEYEPSWNGVTYLSRERQRRFVGVALALDVLIQVPNEPRSLSFALKVNPPDSFSVDQGADAAKDDAHVYDAMLLRAFERVRGQLAQVFFEPKTAAVRGAERP
jgi:hypothetical protein